MILEGRVNGLVQIVRPESTPCRGSCSSSCCASNESTLSTIPKDKNILSMSPSNADVLVLFIGLVLSLSLSLPGFPAPVLPCSSRRYLGWTCLNSIPSVTARFQANTNLSGTITLLSLSRNRHSMRRRWQLAQGCSPVHLILLVRQAMHLPVRIHQLRYELTRLKCA